MNKNSNCPNCGTELKTTLLKSVVQSDHKQTVIINEYEETPKEGYCSKCIGDKYKIASQKMNKEINHLTDRFNDLIQQIPVVSTHSPLHWDYDTLEMVTGQSTTGTGVVTEFASSFTDFFGQSSGRHNSKLRTGEKLCMFQLRKQTYDLGGNAVIATDIDYAEVGSGKGILMVCMTGTAIKLKNLEVLGESRSRVFGKYDEIFNRLRYLNKLQQF
ncbi:heavy metal-binding domain-containing protein [Formosa undariae]|uniref:Heavy metal-binding domain-containing protein n=1 Tax=Formosa undariae TaxID=1325436 RepID=A0ABV5F6T5_9FLAO